MKNKRCGDAQIMRWPTGDVYIAERGRQFFTMACEVWWHALHSRALRSNVPRVDASMISELKAMAEENHRLKRMYAETSMQNDLLKEALGKKH